MDRNSDIRYSTSFQVKKWFLFTLCLIYIVFIVIIAALATIVVDLLVEAVEVADKTTGNVLKREDKDAFDTAKIIWKVVIYVVSAIGILFNLMGLMGAYKEHYCMTMTYAVVVSIGTVGSIASAFKSKYMFVSTAINLLVCVVALTFAHDLHKRRRQASDAFVVTTCPPVNMQKMSVPANHIKSIA